MCADACLSIGHLGWTPSIVWMLNTRVVLRLTRMVPIAAVSTADDRLDRELVDG